MTEPEHIVVTDKRKKGAAPAPEHPVLTEGEADALLAQQVREELEREENAEPEGLPALTAFYVVIDHQGGAKAMSDCNTMLHLDREATVDDMHNGCSIVLRDIQAATTAKHVVFGMQVSAAAMQEKRAAVQTLDSLRGGRPR